MTRKIKHSCNASMAHYELAALAITQVGMMRKFRSSEGFKHDVVLDAEHVAGTAGSYHAYPAGTHTVMVRTETDLGCEHAWCFTWPDLKLLQQGVLYCDHTGFEVDPTISDE